MLLQRWLWVGVVERWLRVGVVACFFTLVVVLGILAVVWLVYYCRAASLMLLLFAHLVRPNATTTV